MIIEHYSDRRVGKPRKPYPQSRDNQWAWIGKPHGFWVSVKGEDDWPSWCLSEDFRLEGLTHRHEVILNGNHDVKIIDTPEALEMFHRQYGYDWWEWRGFDQVGFRGDHKHERWMIDWEKVAEVYDGIIIAPYQWDYRLPMEWPPAIRGHISNWYYGWDCASGCIWNPAAIARVKFMGVTGVAWLEQERDARRAKWEEGYTLERKANEEKPSAAEA